MSPRQQGILPVNHPPRTELLFEYRFTPSSGAPCQKESRMHYISGRVMREKRECIEDGRKQQSHVTVGRQGDLETLRWTHQEHKRWSPIFTTESESFFFVGSSRRQIKHDAHPFLVHGTRKRSEERRTSSRTIDQPFWQGERGVSGSFQKGARNRGYVRRGLCFQFYRSSL